MQTRRIGTLEGPGRQPRLQQLRMAHDAAQKRLRLAAPFEPHHVAPVRSPRPSRGCREALGSQFEEIYNLAFNAMCRLDQRIATTPATTLAGAAVKLRRLLHPELGMEPNG